MIQRTINSIINIFAKENIIDKEDKTYYTNIVLGRMGLEYANDELDDSEDIATLFNRLGDYAAKELKLDKDTFIDEISGTLLPAPSIVNNEFKLYDNKRAAFTKFFKDSKVSYYIKYDRLAKNVEWETKTSIGNIMMTINLSKPEKTPAQIAAAKLAKDVAYPKCVLCKENIGSFGNAKRASRQNIRYIHDTLNGKKVFMHYSPYGYFNEHLIVNNWNHVDMVINDNTLKQLLEFIDKYPFYFLGSNSDIPIVGGSILSHQHYQGGGGTFPVFASKAIYSIESGDAKIEMLDWALSTIKISGKSKEDVFTQSSKVLKAWYEYENKELQIISKKDGNRQNAVTPLARMNDGKYEIFLILRNNGTSKEAPEGIFHVKEDVWNIKKENIGIIEAAGKAILPGRLLEQFNVIAKALKDNDSSLPKELAIHETWFKQLKELKVKGNYLEFVKEQAGIKFAKGLTDCGVFFNHEKEFKTFVNTLK